MEYERSVFDDEEEKAPDMNIMSQQSISNFMPSAANRERREREESYDEDIDDELQEAIRMSLMKQ